MIAVDAMGGDKAPNQIVLGSLLASKKGVSVRLFGAEQKLISLLEEFDSSWRNYNISICDSIQVIDMAEEPVAAIRKKSHSSLVMAVESVKQKKCKAVVSAGNTGAFMAAATFVLGRQPGVLRPPIVGALPIKNNKKVLCLDIGANVDCKPEYLIQFAHLAKNYAHNILGLSNQRIALLANGHEEGKGNSVVKQVHQLLKQSGLNFVGNVEPYAVFDDFADIVISDGFAGNIFLKTIEACAQHFITDGYEIGRDGALLLGVNGIVVAVHGNADAQAIKKAIFLAEKTVANEEKFYGICKKSISESITKNLSI